MPPLKKTNVVKKIIANLDEYNIEKIEEILEYDKLIPIHPRRLNVYNKFYKLLVINKSLSPTLLSNNELQKIALNIERGIFNKSIIGIKSWNYKFEFKYSSLCVRIFSNLDPQSYINNSKLISRLFSKEFTEFELSSFDSKKIFPEQYSKIMSEYIKSLPKISEKEEVPDGMHTCGKCKSKKTTYYQLQTRSAKVGQKSNLLKTYWLCFWKNSLTPIYHVCC
jgi:DNA-directed RNA polymerase subunit M/transcription elongation factor TFIIS